MASLEQIARHRTLLSSLQSPLTVFHVRDWEYENDKGFSECEVNTKPPRGRQVCFDIAHLNKPEVSSVARDFSHHSDIYFSLERLGEAQRLQDIARR
jgi:hypothetical protein